MTTPRHASRAARADRERGAATMETVIVVAGGILLTTTVLMLLAGWITRHTAGPSGPTGAWQWWGMPSWSFLPIRVLLWSTALSLTLCAVVAIASGLHRLARRLRAATSAAPAERGSMTLELAILAPALLAFIALLTLAGRIALAGNTVTQVAHEAARAASIERTATTAHTQAHQTAMASLEAQGIQCGALNVTVGTAGFSAAPGSPSAVTVDVSCTVPLADLTLPGLPGSRTLTGSASSAIDTFREAG